MAIAIRIKTKRSKTLTNQKNMPISNTYKRKTWILTLFFIIFFGPNIMAQDFEFKNSSIKTGIGIGVNEGEREAGVGIVYSLGWQKSFGEKNRFRINPNVVFGGFSPIGISDTRDQFYKISNVGFNIHYDVLRYKALSLVATVGGFVNYSRGLLGTGGRDANNNKSQYLYALYYGGSGSLGIRIDPKKSKLAYEIRPFSIHAGNKNFILGYFMVGIDFKLRK